MSFVGKVFGVFLLVFVLANTPATALEIRGSEQVTVTAVVLPQKTIYVDDAGQIVKILSNCACQAPLVVSVQSSPTRQIPLSQNIAQQYQFLSLIYNMDRIGQVYAATAPGLTQDQKQPSFSLARPFRLSLLQLRP